MVVSPSVEATEVRGGCGVCSCILEVMPYSSALSLRSSPRSVRLSRETRIVVVAT